MSWVQKKLNQGFGIAALVISSLAGSGCVYELITPPKILPKNGQEIPILVNNLYKGTARTDYNRKTNRYYITYNSARMSTIHPDAQLFIYFHEEGHLEGDHLGLDDEGNEIFVDKKLYRQHDKEADCYSGKKVRDEYHYTPQQFENCL